MPIDRNGKTSDMASYMVDDLDSLEVSKLLDELKGVPSVSSEDDMFNLEDVLAEFGSGKSTADKFMPEITVPPEAPVKENAEEISQSEPVNRQIDNNTVCEPAPEKADEKKGAKLITKIVRPWEDGMFGDLDLEAEPEPKPWDKNKKDRKETGGIHDTKPRFKVSGGKHGAPGNMADTIPHIPGEGMNEPIDDSGATRGFRIKKREPQVDRELPGEFIKREEKRVRGLKMRAIMLFLLCLPVCYLMVATQLGWPMLPFVEYSAHPFRFVLVILAAQCVAMALGYDIIASGIRLRPNMESAVVFSCAANLLHAAVSLFNHGVNVHIPYCAVACVTLFFAVYGTYLKKNAWLRASKVAGATKEPMGVFVKDFYGELNVFKHRVEDRETFVGHLTAPDCAERFWNYFAAIVIVASVVFAAVGSFGSGKGETFIWSLSAISSLSAPFFAAMCYAHPFSIVTQKLKESGAAVAGWYAAQEFDGDLQVILCDTDVFPHGSVKLHGTKFFGDRSVEKTVKTISYATSVLKEAESGLYKVFSELLKSEYEYSRNERVSGLKYHESGGLEAVIDGERVLVGTASFMVRMSVQMFDSANIRDAVYVAINSELAGVFNVQYKVSSEVQNGFDSVKRSKIQMVLATIDFNLTPMMVEANFGLSEGKRLRRKKSKKSGKKQTATSINYADYSDSDLIYPEIETRIDLSSNEQTIDRDPCAIVARGGFAPMAFSVIGARRLRSAAIKNTVMSAVSTVLGMLLMFYLVFCGSVAAATPYNVLIYMILWTLPAYITSLRTGDF